LKAQNVSLPNLRVVSTALVLAVAFMSVYSGMNMAYRQTPIMDASAKFLSGPFKGISTDVDTFKKVENLNSELEIARDLGVTDLIALDTPILGVLNPRITTQPIWLAQFWGITPDLLVENCLSGFNSDRKFALYLPNGEPDWSQLEDAFVLCGLSRDKTITSSIKLMKKPQSNILPTLACSAKTNISRANLGQGWWPSDSTHFWSNQGYIHILIPPISSLGKIEIPYLKFNDEVDIRLVKNQSFQFIDYTSNTITIELKKKNQAVDVWLEVSNARRPINLLENNMDVRELGIFIKEMQVSC
jgi:hypothetical protein